MSEYTVKNYTEQGGEVTHIGGKLVFDEGAQVEGMPGQGDAIEVMPNQAALSSSTGSVIKDAVNALLIKLKDAGLMVADSFSMTVTKSVNDSVAGHADRSYNTGKISSVAVADGIITITLSEKVADLKDFDGGNGWGTHKWLGIGVSAGINPITGLKYNGAELTAEDVSEASTCGLSAGYFVRWVAADLVLAGNNTQKSKDTFTLSAAGYQEATFKLRIVEPST